MRLCLISPRPVDSTYVSWWASEEPGRGIARVGAAGIVTVAALAPDDFQITIVDECVDPFDLDRHGDADVFALSINVAQAASGVALAKRLRGLGKTVVVGGPHVSLAPQFFEGRADSIVIGELEPIAEEVFADMRAGTLKPTYTSTKADMRQSPLPRWDLYPNDKSYFGVVQTSRGCPFECHFCDVIQYLGRVQRHKDNAQVTAELQQLYDLGYANVALADDNFTVYRKRARSLLEAIASWNGKEGRDFVSLFTQVSIDVARDPELLRLCADAGLVNAFIGIETNNEASLVESKKRQNLRVDLTEEVKKVVSSGVAVEVGLVTGFDHDERSIFENLLAFGSTLPTSTFSVATLMAPVATPFYDSMKDANRIVEESEEEKQSQGPVVSLVTNIVPAQMSRRELYIGARWLVSRLFHPENFLDRFYLISELLPPAPWERPGNAKRRLPRPNLVRLYTQIFREEMKRDPRFVSVVKQAMRHIRSRPDIEDSLSSVLGAYTYRLHTLRNIGTYDEAWAEMDSPPFGADVTLERAGALGSQARGQGVEDLAGLTAMAK
ncbi:MAG: radical SAM protein [Kiloniellales bacterium]